MIFGKTRMELKVGVFVFMGLVILAVFVFSIGQFRTWTQGYEISGIFNFSNGVKVGAPVRLAGVDVGEVKDADLFFSEEEQKDKVRIRIWVRSKVKIPADSMILVNTLGLLGEKYVEIMPGKDYVNLLTHRQEIIGVDPMPMHEVTALVKDIAVKVDNSITRINNGEGTVGKLLFDETLYDDLEALVKDLKNNPWKLMWKQKEKK